jgi:hypothetical protein
MDDVGQIIDKAYPLYILKKTYVGLEGIMKILMTGGKGFVGRHLERYKELVRGSQFVYKECGRTAGSVDNLCGPDCLYDSIV